MEALTSLLHSGMQYNFSNYTEGGNFDITQYKNPDSYDLETRKIINTLTLQEGINPVGSQKFKAHRYPGDIDIFEPVKICCSLDTATKEIIKNIQKVVSDIKKEPLYFLGDFKAGLDTRYELNLKQSKKKIVSNLMSLEKKKLLSSVETGHLLDLLKTNNIGQIKDELRKHYIVRWDADEILKGVKKLPNNRTLSLFDAIKHNTPVKIDLWAPMNGNYTEITNFLLLMYIDDKGKEHMINIELADRIKSLIGDIKLYSSPEHLKSLKVAKRMWAIGQVINDKKTMRKLYPLFGSDIAQLSQVNSEIETLILMLSKLLNPPFEVIVKQIDRFKSRIGNSFITFNEGFVFKNINLIVTMYRKYGDNIDRDVIITILKEISEYFSQVIEENASDYMRKEGLLNPDYYDYLLEK